MSVLTDVASVVAALAAAVGLILTSYALRQQARSADLASLVAFRDAITDAEASLSGATSASEREEQATNYLNLLEVYATAVNRHLVGSVTREIVRERLINDVAIFAVLAPNQYEVSLTSPETLSELMAFYKANKGDIERAIKREQQRRSSNLT